MGLLHLLSTMYLTSGQPGTVYELSRMDIVGPPSPVERMNKPGVRRKGSLFHKGGIELLRDSEKEARILTLETVYKIQGELSTE
jgi:hypothetical protein